jgi:hypothetical protein
MRFLRPTLMLLYIAAIIGWCAYWSFTPFKAASSLLGFDSPKEYIVLLQNNMELRATGGFLGSFARIRADKGKVSLLKIEDIYTPDGQLEGHVDPPWPIQVAFGQGWYKLRDSNWDPDFPTAVKTMEWFFEHGKEPKSDGMIAVNLEILKSILQITGPVYVPDEAEQITVDNFYEKTQAAVETNFFPGSIQKGTILSKLGKSVWRDIQHLSPPAKIQLAMQILKLAGEKQILAVVHDPTAQMIIHEWNMDGALLNVKERQEDYLGIFESNLGANKANCCIKRDTSLSIGKEKGNVSHVLYLHYENTNPSMLKQPPHYWGGAYVNFLRIGIPLNAKITSLRVGETTYPLPSGEIGTQKENIVDLMKQETNEELRTFVAGDDEKHVRMDIEKREDKGIQFVGFFVLVDALDTKDVHLLYEVPQQLIQSKKLRIQKQSGIGSEVFFINGKQTVLSSDTIFVIQ